VGDEGVECCGCEFDAGGCGDAFDGDGVWGCGEGMLIFLLDCRREGRNGNGGCV
jgi:hypothetical protein